MATNDIAAAAPRLFLSNEVHRCWDTEETTYWVLTQMNLDKARKRENERIRPYKDTVSGQVEFYKISAGVKQPTAGSAIDPGDDLPAFAAENLWKDALFPIRTYVETVTFPGLNIDMNLPARDNEVSVAVVARRMEEHSINQHQTISSKLWAAAQGAKDVATLDTQILDTGAIFNIDPAAAGGTEALWAARVYDHAAKRLLLNQIANYFRRARGEKGARLRVAFVGTTLYGMLVEENNAGTYRMLDVQRFFNYTPKLDGPEPPEIQPIETSLEGIIVGNVLILPDSRQEVTFPDELFALSTDRIGIKAHGKNNPRTKGPMDVSLPSGKDQTRAAIYRSVVAWMSDRSKQVRVQNIKIS